MPDSSKHPLRKVKITISPGDATVTPAEVVITAGGASYNRGASHPQNGVYTITIESDSNFYFARKNHDKMRKHVTEAINNGTTVLVTYTNKTIIVNGVKYYLATYVNGDND